MTTKEEWMMLVEREEGALFVQSLVEQVLARTKEILFEKQIEKKMLPFTANFAKETLLSMIKWRFFQRDPGQVFEEIWVPDQEPEPVSIDCVARGAIPLIPAPARPMTHSTTKANAKSGVRTVRQSKQDLVTTSNPRLVAASRRSSLLPGGQPASRRTSLIPPLEAAHLKSNTTTFLLPCASSASSLAEVDSISTPERKPTTSSSSRPTYSHTRTILQENARTLERIAQMQEKDATPIDVSYDHEGKVAPMKRVAVGKYGLHGVSAKIVRGADRDIPSASTGTGKSVSFAKRNASTGNPNMTRSKSNLAHAGKGTVNTASGGSGNGGDSMIMVFSGGEAKPMSKHTFYEATKLGVISTTTGMTVTSHGLVKAGQEPVTEVATLIEPSKKGGVGAVHAATVGKNA